MWLIQNGVVLSIMPGVRRKGQHRGGVNLVDDLAFAIPDGAIWHPICRLFARELHQCRPRNMSYTSLESCFARVTPAPGE
jgi:hypothetical protein